MSIRPANRPSAPRSVLRLLTALVPIGVAASGSLHFLLEVDALTLLPSVPTCVFRGLTDTPCPGCGMTRALLSLGQLDIVRAMEFHPFALPITLLALTYASLGRVPFERYHTLGAHLGIITLMVLWGVRLLG